MSGFQDVIISLLGVPPSVCAPIGVPWWVQVFISPTSAAWREVPRGCDVFSEQMLARCCGHSWRCCQCRGIIVWSLSNAQIIRRSKCGHFDLRSVWDESRNTYVSGYSNEQLVFILILKLIITLAPCSLLSFDLGLGLFSIVGSFSCHKKRLAKLYYAFECFCYSSRFPFLSWRLFLKRFFFFSEVAFYELFFSHNKVGDGYLTFSGKVTHTVTYIVQSYVGH